MSIHEHLAEFGAAPDGRLFVGDRNRNELPKLTYMRAWKRAREVAFTEEFAASSLAKRPYDLRHAAVSTWLNGGVPPTQVAEWAGQSVEILLRIYAKCLDGGLTVLQHRRGPDIRDWLLPTNIGVHLIWRAFRRCANSATPHAERPTRFSSTAKGSRLVPCLDLLRPVETRPPIAEAIGS